MKSAFLKYLVICTGFLLLNLPLSAQSDLEITRVKSAKLVEVLNNVEFLERGRTNNTVIRVYKLHNGSGSAGMRTGEVSHNLLVAISEFDEAPDQNLFEIGTFLNPVFLKWEDNKDQGVFSIEYGPANKRLTVKLAVDIYSLRIITPE